MMYLPPLHTAIYDAMGDCRNSRKAPEAAVVGASVAADMLSRGSLLSTI